MTKEQSPFCACNGRPCGVGKSYEEIFQSWSSHYISKDFTINDALRIHKKWKSIGKLAAKGRL